LLPTLFPSLRFSVGKSSRLVTKSTEPRRASGNAYASLGCTRSTRAPPTAVCSNAEILVLKSLLATPTVALHLSEWGMSTHSAPAALSTAAALARSAASGAVIALTSACDIHSP
jgi:hypothetical protein